MVSTADLADAWLVCVLDERGALEAGARIHLRERHATLPIETALAGNALLERKLADRACAGVAEVGGLWASENRSGSGIGGAVIASCVAYAAVVGVRHLVSLAHQYNRFTRRVGFDPDLEIGPQPYPDARYRSTVNWCDARDLASADTDVQAAIRAMRRDAFAGHPIGLDRYPTASPNHQPREDAFAS